MGPSPSSMASSQNTVLCKWNAEKKKSVASIVGSARGEAKSGLHQLSVVQVGLVFTKVQHCLAYLTCNLVTHYSRNDQDCVTNIRAPLQLFSLIGRPSDIEVKPVDNPLQFLADSLDHVEFELRNIEDDLPVEGVVLSVLVAFEKV